MYLANNATDEEFQRQWYAIVHLRILNKFHFEAFEMIIL